MTTGSISPRIVGSVAARRCTSADAQPSARTLIARSSTTQCAGHTENRRIAAAADPESRAKQRAPRLVLPESLGILPLQVLDLESSFRDLLGREQPPAVLRGRAPAFDEDAHSLTRDLRSHLRTRSKRRCRIAAEPHGYHGDHRGPDERTVSHVAVPRRG